MEEENVYFVVDLKTGERLAVFETEEEAVKSPVFLESNRDTGVIPYRKDFYLADLENDARHEAFVKVIEGWSFAARTYWARAYLALEEGNIGEMRAQEKLARDAERRASPETRLLAAVFGGDIGTPPEEAVEQGRNLPEDAIKQARAAVLACRPKKRA